MTPKEKAQELWWKFFHAQSTEENQNLDGEIAYQCALIAVNELIYFSSNQSLSIDFDGDYYCDYDFFVIVKQEIEKL